VEFEVIPVSDLSVTQIAPSDPSFTGSNLVYTLIVSNAGPSDATDVVLNDNLPSLATIVSASTSQGTISEGGSSVSVTLGTINSGSAAVVTLVLNSYDAGLFLNNANVSGANQDSNPGNNQSQSMIAIVDSGALPLAEEITVPALDIAYDSSHHRILASLAGTVGNLSNCVIGIDAQNAAIGPVLPVGDQPGQLALSDDDQYLYLGLSMGGVARINLPSETVDQSFPINSPGAPYGPYTAEDMAVMPGAPNTLAVARGGIAGYYSGVAVFDSGIQRPDTIQGIAGASGFHVQFADPTNLFVISPFGFQVNLVTPTGLTNESPLFSAYSGDFAVNGGSIITSSGQEFDPNSGILTATYPASGPVATDPVNGRVYFLTGAGQGGFFWYLTLRAFDTTTHSELWSVPFNGYIGNAVRLITLGTNGLACLTDANRMFIVRMSPLAAPTSDVSISQTVSPNPVSDGGQVTCTFMIQNQGPWAASDIIVSNTIPTGMTFVSATSSQGTCVVTNGALVCSLGSLLNGYSATITLNVTADTAGTITNTAIVMADQNDPVLTNNSAASVIIVNAEPSVSVADTIAVQGANPVYISFALSLSGLSTATVSVGYQTADGTAVAGQDYDAASGVLTFPPGITSEQLSLPIILNSPDVQDEKVFYLNLSNSFNATLGRSQAVATIIKQVFYGISIKGTSVENRGNDTNAIFTLTLWPPSSTTVNLQYQTLDGTAIAGLDYGPRAGTATFPPGTTNVALTIPAYGNSVADATKTFYVMLSSPQNAILTANEAVGTIVDDALLGQLTISGVQVQGTNVEIQFNTINGRHYRLLRSDSLSSGSWSIVADGIPGTGNPLVVTDSVGGSGSSHFYRLVLLP
jgi:uncharacterized repeat protein (TIGR01451 family)